MPIKSQKNKFLIFRTDRIGEVMLSTVAVRAIKNSIPASSVSYAVSGYSRPILENINDIDEIITFETKDNKSIFFKAFRLSLLLRKFNFDAAIILNPHKASHLAVFMAGIPIRVGFKRKWGFLLTRGIEDNRDKGEKHETEYTMDLLRLIGVNGKVSFPDIKIEEKENVKKFLHENNIHYYKPVVLIHPGTSNPDKMWGKDNFSSLIRKIKDSLGSDVILLGDVSERQLANDIIALSGNKALNSAGEFNLDELIFLISKSSVFIGNDAGPMHIAEAIGIPLVAIFVQNGPGIDSKRWGPISERSVTLQKNKDDISVEAVLNVIKRLLKK